MVSFYKLCGWPDGLGALIVRRGALNIMRLFIFLGPVSCIILCFGMPVCVCLTNDVELAPVLHKRFFGGGTVSAVAALEPFVRLRSDLSARLEDGTLPFLSLISLLPGLRRMREIGMQSVERCVCCILLCLISLTCYLFDLTVLLSACFVCIAGMYSLWHSMLLAVCARCVITTHSRMLLCCMATMKAAIYIHRVA